MPLTDPKITVLMPAYNAGQYIEDAIRSVLDQSFADFELLIVNDGSTDNTEHIIRSFRDDRIVLINQENKGVSAALNTGLAQARALYIARFDADDICYADRLAVQYKFMAANPEYSIIGSAVDYTDAAGHFIFTHNPEARSQEEIQQIKYAICPFIHSSVLYKRAVVLAAGGYNELALNYEDHFLWLNVLQHEKACNLPQSLVKVRLNPESVCIDEKWQTSRFRKIKQDTLTRGEITAAEGAELHRIIQKHYSTRVKESAYYALCGKKFLLNNYQPEKARVHMKQAIKGHPFRLDNYLLYLVSYFPERFINWLHNTTSRALMQN